ncbi:MAG: hypothetical protein H7039_05060 [Bryobacteraceae bacterium]|nr:hypothetical protein [Bryobacteraceae bacterium]
MTKNSEAQFAEPGNQRRGIPALKPVDPFRFSEKITGVLVIALLCSGVAFAQGDSPTALRQFIGGQVGGIQKLMVPDDAHLPQPRLPDGTLTSDQRFQTTEAKVYLGKLLFFDPVRTARILPEFGGVLATRQTGSCGSCHLGEAAGKAGTLLNFNVGGEGRGYTDASGNFIPRRRARTDVLPRLRQAPLFPDDTLVDELPTLTDVFQLAVGNPGRGRKFPLPGPLLRTGRLDAVDSVGRNSPNLVGVAFNNRQLLGGFAGEPDASPGALNPFGFPAQESVTQLLLDAHRMQDFEAAELQKIPAFVKLFRDAFPPEAAQADAARDLNLLVNDTTVLRATASFLRTIVTRNTLWDKFLAGDNNALSLSQRRGARLVFTPATDGGAGCYTCHVGPMLNKQVNDPDVTGTGQLVEENFFNLGLSDHPVQALNRLAKSNPNFIDDGRKEITGRDSDAFKFRTLTLRQLRGSRTFFHGGSFTDVRDVVRYFNAGVPQNAVTGAASTLTPRFTNPRGPNVPPGLGLSDGQVDDITDFLENALYDPAFVQFDPNSTTRTMQPNVKDLTYSVYRPDLAALGARDGFMLSGLPISNNDALSRRDAGLEFLNVNSQVRAELTRSTVIGGGRQQEDVYRITNTGQSSVDTHLLLMVRGLSGLYRMGNASGTASNGDPYLRVFLTNGLLLPGESIVRTFRFNRLPSAPPPSPAQAPVRGYSLDMLSGQGNP